MRVSVNEIELALKRAAAGAGWPWGLAEDIGRAAAWAATHGLTQAVAEALDAIDAGYAPPEARREGGSWGLSGNIAAVAPSAVDLALAEEAGAEVRLARLGAPALVAGFAGLAAREQGAAFRLEGAAGDALLPGPGGLEVEGGLPAPSEPARLVRLAGVSTPAPAGRQDKAPAGVVLGDTLWQRLLDAAARLLVPATEASRLRGAGAGLTDND